MTKLNEKKINGIIGCYKQTKVLDKHSQKVVALSRNEDFLRLLEGVRKQLGEQFFRVKNLPEKRLTQVSKKNPLIQHDFPHDEERLRLLGYKKGGDGIGEKITRRYYVLEAYQLEWRAFCEAWGIKSSWDGRLSSLSRGLRESVRIGTLERPTIGRKEIILSLDEWATEKQVRLKWREVQKLQKEFLAGSKEAKGKLGRDLCWYRLAESGWNITDIADFWLKTFPEEIEILVLRRLKHKQPAEVERAKKGKAPDELTLLKQIKENALVPLATILAERHKGSLSLAEANERSIKEKKAAEDLWKNFQAEWQDYLNRKIPTHEGMVTIFSPLDEMISKAVSRIKKAFKKQPRFSLEHLPLKLTYLD